MPILKRMLIESSESKQEKKTKIDMFRLNCKMLYIFIFPLWSHLPKHTRTPSQLPTRYSNERTFLEWIHFATILAAAGLRIKLQINHKMPFSERCFSDQGNQLNGQFLYKFVYICMRCVFGVFALYSVFWMTPSLREASWCYTQPKRPILLMYRIDFHWPGGGSCMFNFGIYWI